MLKGRNPGRFIKSDKFQPALEKKASGLHSTQKPENHSWINGVQLRKLVDETLSWVGVGSGVSVYYYKSLSFLGFFPWIRVYRAREEIKLQGPVFIKQSSSAPAPCGLRRGDYSRNISPNRLATPI